MLIHSHFEADTKEYVILVDGRFDSSQGQTFDAILDTIPAEADGVTLDMRDCQYIDSTALGLLLKLREVVKNKGLERSVQVRKANPEVKRILAIAHFDRVFDIA